MGDWDAMQHRLLAHDDEEEVHRDMDRASDQVKGPALSEPARYISGASLGVFGDPDADLDHREIHGGEPLDDSNRHGGFGPDHDANYDQHYDDERGYVFQGARRQHVACKLTCVWPSAPDIIYAATPTHASHPPAPRWQAKTRTTASMGVERAAASNETRTQALSPATAAAEAVVVVVVMVVVVVVEVEREAVEAVGEAAAVVGFQAAVVAEAVASAAISVASAATTVEGWSGDAVGSQWPVSMTLRSSFSPLRLPQGTRRFRSKSTSSR